MALVTARLADQDQLALTGIGFDFVGEFAVYADLDCALELTPEEFGRGAFVQISATRDDHSVTLAWSDIPPFELRAYDRIQLVRSLIRLPRGTWRLQLTVNERVVCTRDVRCEEETA